MAGDIYRGADVRVRDVGIGAAVLFTTVAAVILESVWNAGWRTTTTTLIIGIAGIVILLIWVYLVKPNPSARFTRDSVPAIRTPKPRPAPEQAVDDIDLLAAPQSTTPADLPGVLSPGADFF
jgi:hypothetical protein